MTRFLAEKALLQPLPDVPPQLAVWAKVKVHRDGHIQFDRCLYSVPFRLMGQTLWLKATDAVVTLYRDQEPVASHPRQTRPGARSTVQDHLPPEALAWKPYGTQRLEAALEAACARAVNFGGLRYRAVKAILAKGLDQATPTPATATELADTYTRGGRFCRDPQTLLH